MSGTARQRRTIGGAFLTLLAVMGLLAPGESYAIPPVVYVATRIAAGSYAVRTFAEEMQALVGNTVKELDASLAPITGVGPTAGVRIPTSTAAESVPVAPTAPATATSTYTAGTYRPGWTFGYCPGGATMAGTMSEACGVGVGCLNTNSASIDYTLTGSSAGTCSVHSSEPADYSYGLVTVSGPAYTCPAGYTLSGTACNLSNARAAVPDGKVDYQRTGVQLSPYSGEEAGTMADLLSQSTITSTNDTLTISGYDNGQRPQKISIQSTADGGSILTQVLQKNDAAGQTYLQTTQATINPQAVVTAVQTSNSAGQLTANTTNNTWTVSTVTASTVAPAVAPAELTLPTDYARQGEAASAATSIMGHLTSLFTSNANPTPTTESIDARKTAMEGLCTGAACDETSSLHPGSSWMPSLLPGDPVACTPLSFRAVWGSLDTTTELDLCPYLAMIRTIIGWLLNIAAIVYLWRRFTNMQNGG